MNNNKLGGIRLIQGECLAEMDKLIADGITVDAIICDPPYGTTTCKWDSVIPFEAMWKRLNKLIKPNGAIVLFGSEPFSSLLRISNIKNYKYDWIWEKSIVSHFAQAPYRPLTVVENICVFSFGGVSKNAKIRMKYNPQGLKNCNKICKGKGHSDHRPSNKIQKDYIQTKTGYPKHLIYFKSDSSNLHPTQKPVALMEYLIKTYTDENELVLDFTAGSFTTAIACINSNRRFIGIEKDDKYFEIGKKRLKNMQGFLIK
jgi:site-specific DNA-methyltransferase (adenine-specific)